MYASMYYQEADFEISLHYNLTQTHLKRERDAHDSRFFATTRQGSLPGKDFATTSVLVRVFFFVVEHEYCIQTFITFVNEVPALFFSTVFHIIIIIEWF